MNKPLFYLTNFILLVTLVSCSDESTSFIEKLRSHSEFHSDGFVFPVGKSNTDGYYNAQKFGENNHLGEDWNGIGGGNTDLGDPIYAAANGYVFFAENIGGGWGNVIRVVHYLPDHEKYSYLESVYAHCYEISVKTGDFVKRGQKIGTIGTNDGQYLAHLHFELRHVVGWSLLWGYQENKYGFLNPTNFIEKNRPN